MQDSFRLWDWPLRLFHWLLAGSVTAALLTGWLGGSLMPWHARLGSLVLGLLVFRLAWGLCGSTYARWGYILHSLAGLPRYLRGQWQAAGHNPLGVLSVLAMLGLLFAQVLSGLLATDDIATHGPLQPLVSAATSDWLSGLHRQGKWWLLALIGLHVTAIGFYALRGKPLWRAMLSGRARREHAQQADARGGRWPVALLALLLAVAVVWAVERLPAHFMPAPAAAAPALAW